MSSAKSCPLHLGLNGLNNQQQRHLYNMDNGIGKYTSRVTNQSVNDWFSK